MIAVFFTHDVSLELWEKRGMFSREVRFYQELAKRVGGVSFFTYGENDDRYRDRLGPDIRVFSKRCKCPPSHYALILPFVFRKELRQADAIRIHQVAGALPALIAHWLYRKPLMVRAGFQWYRFAKQQGAPWWKLAVLSLVERMAYRSAKAIIHTTKADADFVARRYKIAREKIHVISNFVDTDLFQPTVSPVILDEPKTSEVCCLCFIGRLEPQKNVAMLLEAMQGVDAKLIVYGEGSLHDELEALARTLGVNADFRGRIANEELPRALNDCEIFVLPSLYEGNPKVLLEAMACGRAVIGTNVDGIRTVIQDGRTGLLCDLNANALHAQIKKVLEDRHLRLRLGAYAREYTLATASLEHALQTELPFYS